MIEECFGVIEPLLGTKVACAAVGRARATHYRRRRPGRVTERGPRPAPANKLTESEVQTRGTGSTDGRRGRSTGGRRMCRYRPTRACMRIKRFRASAVLAMRDRETVRGVSRCRVFGCRDVGADSAGSVKRTAGVMTGRMDRPGFVTMEARRHAEPLLRYRRQPLRRSDAPRDTS